MDTSFRLPPNARDFQVYQRVTLEAVTTRQAAADFSLSQTRIRQIVQRVSHWLAETLPPSTEASDAAHLRLAQHIAADRLQWIYGHAMHGWRTTSESKYAGVVLRVIAAQTKLPVIPGTLEALAADALEGPLPCGAGVSPDTSERDAEGSPPTPDSQFPTPSSSPPPLRDCSTSAPKPPTAAPASLAQPSPTPDAASGSNNHSPTTTAARRAFLAPAQSSLDASDSLSSRHTPCAVQELKITPQQLGFSLQKKLSRSERRKLRHKIGS